MMTVISPPFFFLFFLRILGSNKSLKEVVKNTKSTYNLTLFVYLRYRQAYTVLEPEPPRLP